MSHDTTVTYTCDRCGIQVARPADTKIAQEPLPPGWSVLALTANDDCSAETYELCGECRFDVQHTMRIGLDHRAGIVRRQLPAVVRS